MEGNDNSETISYDYYDVDLSTENPDRCYTPNLECIKNLKTLAPICAFKKKMGLSNFYSICEIHLQNCLIRPLEDMVPYGEISKNDVIYYNNRGRDCFFYMRQSKNLNDAVKLYHDIAAQTGNKKARKFWVKY
ncbi:uncharacterized protein LOC113495487 [Trichoplusia ni]|uniref:Uncharacterized protein LOC113495487 n=1 Tax=Trichoplusia ni TaxID=7111 RepID=A0A7E5VP04_TRINI|nr:uncharacterized protein LOC113495487 [Trichoplusia ni]